MIGEASRIIENLELSSRNYEAAWNLSEKRCPNRQLLVHNHVKAILEFRRITKESHMSLLRRLLDSLQNYLRALYSLELPIEPWDDLLVYVVTKKFDPETKRKWEYKRSRVKDLPTELELIEFMGRQCNSLEKINAGEQSRSTGTTYKNRVSTYLTQSNVKVQLCPVCQQPHGMYSCTKLLSLTPQNHMQEAKAHRLCMECLRSGHGLTQCKSGRCGKSISPIIPCCTLKNNERLNLPFQIQARTGL